MVHIISSTCSDFSLGTDWGMLILRHLECFCSLRVYELAASDFCENVKHLKPLDVPPLSQAFFFFFFKHTEFKMCGCH